MTLTRRRMLAGALAAGVTGWAGPAWAGSPRITLPAPAGPHRVGTVPLHLVDGSRDLMVSIWYPAGDTAGRPRAPWMAAAPMRALLASSGLNPDFRAPLTAAREGAPVLPAPGRRPVILFSHASNGHRSEATIVVEQLAARGYVVVAVDHPGDSYSETPDGDLITPADDNGTPWDHAYDILTVLDRLGDLAAGRNPDAQRRSLPQGLSSALDLRRIGMVGYSKGATATALVMNTTSRVRAGLSLDGPMQSQPPATDIDRPFMMMTGEYTRTNPDGGAGEFWPLLRGWRLDIRAEGSTHATYVDTPWLIPQVVTSEEEVISWIGHLPPARAVRIQQAYPPAFFDEHLRHRPQPLLRGPSRAFPEVHFTV